MGGGESQAALQGRALADGLSLQVPSLPARVGAEQSAVGTCRGSRCPDQPRCTAGHAEGKGQAERTGQYMMTLQAKLFYLFRLLYFSSGRLYGLSIIFS